MERQVRPQATYAAWSTTGGKKPTDIISYVRPKRQLKTNVSHHLCLTKGNQLLDSPFIIPTFARLNYIEKEWEQAK